MQTEIWGLLVIWANGDVDCWEYEIEEDALAAERAMKMANGNQLQWTCVRPKLVK